MTNNPHRDTLKHQLGGYIQVLARGLWALDIDDPADLGIIVQRLRAWTDHAMAQARVDLGPGNDPPPGQPF
jgi:hypothetical protein